MKTVDTITLIATLEIRVKQSIGIALNILQNLNPDILLQPSVTGGWSIAQCLEHLNSYGDFYLPHIEKALHNNTHRINSSDFKSGRFGNYFVNMMQIHSGKKYKAVKKHTPSKVLDAHSVVARFIHQQELLLTYLELSKNKDLNTIKIPVSISAFIKLKLGDVFQFIIAHNERHLIQAQRNLPHNMP